MYVDYRPAAEGLSKSIAFDGTYAYVLEGGRRLVQLAASTPDQFNVRLLFLSVAFVPCCAACFVLCTVLCALMRT